MISRKDVLLALSALAWLSAIAAGFGALQRYASTEGSGEAPATAMDDFLAQHRRPGRALVVMAVHPLCPCTGASLAELGDLLARSRGACDALLLQYEPRRPPADWHSSVAARELGGVTVPAVRDPDGEIAAALGARTSGHVVFADARGTIRFHGGLTNSRGHRGRSPAQDAILDVLRGSHPAQTTAPVYGCALSTDCNPTAGQ